MKNDDENRWILMGTEKIHDNYNQLMGIFMNEYSGKIKKIRLEGTSPYCYTLLTEDELKNISMIKENFMNKNGWKDNILGMERIKKRYPTTQEIVEVTKIYGKTTWDLHSPHNKSGIADMIPDKLVFNKNHIFYDYFLNEYGLIMGMSYKIDDNNFSMIVDKPTNEIMEIVNKMNIPKYMKKTLIDKLLPLFFTKFPDITNHILAIDIEVDNDYKQALNPFLAKYPISSVSLYSKDYQMVYVLSDEVRKKNYEYTLPENINIVICMSEGELIKRALNDIINRREKGIVTFNGDGFDIPYLMCRAHNLNIHEFDRNIWGRYDFKKNTAIKGIRGKFLIDLMQFFKNPSIKNYSFPNKYVRNSLDEICGGLLGESKYKFEGRINQLNANELAYYNYIDTVRTFELMIFNDCVVPNIWFMFMRLSGRTFEDVHRRQISSILTGLINNVLFDTNTLQPNKVILSELGDIESKSIIDGKKFEGAKVFDPHELNSVGMWVIDDDNKKNTKAITCVDFASLYPSEIKMRNLSFDTVNCNHDECMNNKMPDLPHHVCISRTGILSILIGFIRDLRVSYFKKHKKENTVFGIVEQTLKVLINAGYGIMGSDKFIYYCAPIAEGTTAYGRYDIGRVEKFCVENGVKILAGDTDSVFLYKADEKFLQDLFAWVNDNLELEMGIDYRGDFMIIHEKKNYIIDNEGKTIIKGMTGKKTNTPAYIRNCFSDVTEIIREYYNDVPKMKKIIINKINEYVRNLDHRKFDPYLMKKTVKLGKNINEYDTEGQHVKAAKKLAKYIRSKIDDKTISDNIIVPKDTYIDFVIEKSETGRTPTPLIMIENNNSVDIKYYKDTLVKTLSQILKPLKIDLNQFLIDHRQSNLDEWF